MGNEMGNNNTSGLKDEENTRVETCKTSLVDTTHENDTLEEHQLVPEVEGKDFHDKVANLASDDPRRIGDPCIENQTSSIEGETPQITIESTTAEERDSKLQPDTSPNDSGHEKPLERNMEESELQGTMQYQLEKHDSSKKDDEEDVTISTSDGLEPKESMPVEACKASLLDSTREIDRNEENQIGAEVEGNDFYEKVAYSATDDRKMIEDLCIGNLTSSTTDLEEDEEDGMISRSDDLEPKENVTAEACQTSLLDSTPKYDTNEENELVAEVEEKGFHEKVAYLATDDPEKMEDPCIENQTSRTKEQEDSEVPPLGEFPQDTLESTELREEDGKVQPVMLSSDSGHKEPIEQNNKEYVLQSGAMQYQLDKQVCLHKDDEEDGIISTPQDLEATDSKIFESNHQGFVTVPADQYVEVGSGSLLGSMDCQGTGSTSDFEAYGPVLITETMKSMELNADSSSDPALQAKRDALPPKEKACDEQLKSSEDQSDTKDGEEVEIGSSNKTLSSSYEHVGLDNKCNVELPIEVNLIDNPKSEPEALVLSSSHLEVPAPRDKCIVLEEEIIPPGKELENGDEKHYTNQIQPCLQSRMESEPDCDKSSEATMVEPTNEKSETVSMINPLCNKVCQTEGPKCVGGVNLVVIRLNKQHEANEDQCYQESERKLEVVPELGIVSPEPTIQHLSHKEDESVGNITDQEREDNTKLVIEMEETEKTEHDCLPPEENTVHGNETVPSINDSITNLKKENSGDFFATENQTIDFTSWIAEALVSMNNLEAEMLGQQVTQHNEAHQAEVAAAESKNFAEVETSSVSVSSGSETQETVGRSSTVSTESDPDNLNIVHHAQIQKSPSFSLDLQNEARTEESDSTPLLFQDKAEVENSSSQGEKVIALERSESEESKTPFLGFLKEEEETNVVKKNIRENHSPAESSVNNLSVTTKKATTTSSKGKEKRKYRPSLFSNCLCCATVIN